MARWIIAAILAVTIFTAFDEGTQAIDQNGHAELSVVTSLPLVYTDALVKNLQDFSQHSRSWKVVSLVRLRYAKRDRCPLSDTARILLVCIKTEETDNGAHLSFYRDFFEHCGETVAKGKMVLLLHDITPGNEERVTWSFIKTNPAISNRAYMILTAERLDETHATMSETVWKNLTNHLQTTAFGYPRQELNKDQEPLSEESTTAQAVEPEQPGQTRDTIDDEPHKLLEKIKEPFSEEDPQTMNDKTPKEDELTEWKGFFNLFGGDTSTKEIPKPAPPEETPTTDIREKNEEEQREKTGFLSFFGRDTSTKETPKPTPTVETPTTDITETNEEEKRGETRFWSLLGGDTSTKDTPDRTATETPIANITQPNEEQSEGPSFLNYFVGKDTTTKTPSIDNNETEGEKIPTNYKPDYLAISIIVFAFAGLLFHLVNIGLATLKGLFILATVIAKEISGRVIRR